MACIVLGRSGSPSALEPLRRVLWQSSSASVRRRAVLGLKDLKAPGSAGDLAAVLDKDPSPEVRGRAADALGAIGDAAALPALRKGLLDPDGLVRFFSARALVKDFGLTEGMEPLFALARWDGGPLKDSLLWSFLKAYTGKNLPGKEKAWRDWWGGAAEGFDAASHAKVFDLCEKADDAERGGDPDGALEIYRSIRKIDPRHAGACDKVSELLNSRAWNIAVSGGDFASGLKLAEESVDAKAGANNIDTLAVLQFLTGRKEDAVNTLEKAIPGYKGSERAMLEGRLAEIRKGKVELH